MSDRKHQLEHAFLAPVALPQPAARSVHTGQRILDIVKPASSAIGHTSQRDHRSATGEKEPADKGITRTGAGFIFNSPMALPSVLTPQNSDRVVRGVAGALELPHAAAQSDPQLHQAGAWQGSDQPSVLSRNHAVSDAGSNPAPASSELHADEDLIAAKPMSIDSRHGARQESDVDVPTGAQGTRTHLPISSNTGAPPSLAGRSEPSVEGASDRFTNLSSERLREADAFPVAHAVVPYAQAEDRSQFRETSGKTSPHVDQLISSPSVATNFHPDLNSHSIAFSAPPGMTTGAEFATPESQATRLVHEPFAAIDAGQTHVLPTWTATGAHRAEAGFLDPSIGWVAVRAQGSAVNTIHATVVPATAEAAQVLGPHLAGLNAYIAHESPHLDPISLSTPDAGAGQALGDGQDRAQHQHRQQQNPEAAGSDVRLLSKSTSVATANEEIQYSPAAFGESQHVSVFV
ncbi:MAG TPA: hypothetical protein VGI45_30405 [Terracidiphilus sp.]